MSNATSAPLDGHTLIRPKLDLSVGGLVRNDQGVYRITSILDYDTVIGANVETNRSSALSITGLQPVVQASPELLARASQDVHEIGDVSWRIAQERFAAIKPLLSGSTTGKDIAKRAKEISVDVTTLYRWLRRYRALGVVTALLPAKRGWKEGRSRMRSETDDVIAEVLRDKYLTEQRCSAQKAIREVHRVCADRGVPLPGAKTVRKRIASLSERSVLRSRGFRERAAQKFKPAPGSFPNADFPLAVVQIDHTPVDIILVDDVHRKPIGRPWITLAIDVYSRMVTGYYLSFDPPSETSVAMCVAHSILPKEEWLQLHNVDARWEARGMMSTIHVDNGAEFRSDTFRNACVMHNINLEYRPVKQPRYGGHIERLLGTLLYETHDLPGTTFSSIKHREGYDSEKHSAMTKSDFERWFVTWICKAYHQRPHRTTGMTPSRLWEIGIHGGAGVQGRGLPQLPANRLSLLLDFLPTFRRTIQPYGVEIEGRRYYADVLRPWINAADPKESGGKRQFPFRRDPRDISEVWFRDPELNQYFRIPFANQSLPPMSAWEHQQVRERLKEEGLKSVDDAQLRRALTELREQVEQAKEKTKRARRQSQRQREHAKAVSPVNPLPQSSSPAEVAKSPSSLTLGMVDGVLEAYEEIE